MHNKKSSRIRLAREFVVLLGAHDLNESFEEGRITAVVQSVNIHPDWNTGTENYDADIAVLVLTHPVFYTQYIKPICLIRADSPASLVTNGVVIGFGKSEDQSKKYENIPKVLQMPIHDDSSCFLKFYLLARFSSKRTFCGGTANGTGACHGDSGGGFYVRYNGVFYLRGLVSASLLDDFLNCDVNAYSIFTNMLNFNDWVQSIPVERN